MFQIWPFKPKTTPKPDTLIEFYTKNDRSYLQFEHNNQKYIAFYTNTGTAGTSIYEDIESMDAQFITRIDINPLSTRDLLKEGIESKEYFIEYYLKPAIDEQLEVNSIRDQFKTTVA